MQRITRYVVAELLSVFLITLVAMTVFVLLGVVATEAVREGLGPAAIARLLPYSIPMALRFTVPGTMLFAACSVFGRMSAANEILALKSLGVSPLAIVMPALVLSVFVSCFTVWLNDLAVSWGTAGINRVVLQSLEQIVYGRLRTQRSYSNQRGLAIHVKEVRGQRLIRPTLSFQPAADAATVVITADEAVLKLDSAADALIVSFTNMVVDGGSGHGVFPDRSEFAFPLSLAARHGGTTTSPSDFPMYEIPKAVRETERRIDQLNQYLAASAAYRLSTGDFAGLEAPEWGNRLAEITIQTARLNRLRTEPWRRWATGFSCLFFVFIGAPLAILLRNSDFWTSFGACFAPILVVYYPLFMAGVDRAKTGALPPFVVWGGNLVLAGVGSWLLRRVLRH